MHHLSPVLSYAPAHQTKPNSNKHAERIRYLVIYVCAAVEGGLDELNYAGPKARALINAGISPKRPVRVRGNARAGKGNKVYEFITSLWPRLHLKLPEHRDG